MPHAFVYPALALCAGVLLGIAFAIPLPASIGGLIGAFALSLAALRRRWPLAVLIASCAGWGWGGASLAGVADRQARDPPLRQLLARIGNGDEAVTCIGTIAADAAPSPAGVSLRISVSAIARRGVVWPVSGDVLVTVLGEAAARERPAWTAGRGVRVSSWLHEPGAYRDPGVPDMALALGRRGIALTGTVKSSALVEVTPGSRADEAAAAWRARVRHLVQASVGAWDARSAAIVLAVILGDRAGLDDRDERRLQEAGTYHVIAISGGNIAILAGLLLVAGRLVGVHWRLQYLSTAALLAVYAAAIEGGTSVTRAAAMAGTYLVARSLDHESSAPTALAIAAAAIVCASPLALMEPGFLLTFGATVALVVWAVESKGRRERGTVAGMALDLLAASAVVEAVLLPVAAWYFNRVTVAGLVLNFAAIPLMAVVQVGGMIAALAAALHGGAGVVTGWVPHQAAQWLLGSSALVSWWPWLTWRIPSPSPWLIALYYAMLAMLATRRLWIPGVPARARLAAWSGWQRPGYLRPVHVAGGAAACLLGWIAWVPHASVGRPPPGTMRMVAIDVGQGDATLLQLPGGRAILVDAGGLGPQSRFDIAERVLAPVLWALGVTRLEVLAISHGDRDHAGGAPGVLEIFRPREIWEGIAVPPDLSRASLVAEADRRRVGWRSVRPADEWRDGPVTITAWHPPAPDWERQRVRNDDSVVLDVRFGQVSIVLPGDIGAGTEALLVKVPRAPLRVLKVPHHGSAGSSSLTFLHALAPNVAIVSCGAGNRFGHPAPAVLERLASVGASVYRTDRQGAITVETDGTRLRVAPFVPNAESEIRFAPRPRGRTLQDVIRRWVVRTLDGPGSGLPASGFGAPGVSGRQPNRAR